jgi:hypothetical protein
MFLPFGFSIQEFVIFYVYCQKNSNVCEIQHTPLVKIDDFLKVAHLLWV